MRVLLKSILVSYTCTCRCVDIVIYLYIYTDTLSLVAYIYIYAYKTTLDGLPGTPTSINDLTRFPYLESCWIFSAEIWKKKHVDTWLRWLHFYHGKKNMTSLNKSRLISTENWGNRKLYWNTPCARNKDVKDGKTSQWLGSNWWRIDW